ncbi:MAG: DUF447 family protein [Pirellula sp.]|nr:DUF447 family protein [Pirellula sp.]
MHAAPIGPHVDYAFRDWTLYPFQTSTTFANLHRTGRAVFHITDDAFLLTATVLGYGNRQLSSGQSSVDGSNEQRRSEVELKWRNLIEKARRANHEPEIGWVLESSHRYYCLQITAWDTSTPRAKGICRVVKWNRAKHSLLELAILVSRRHMTDPAIWQEEWERHCIIINKTAGTEELEALALLTSTVMP